MLMNFNKIQVQTILMSIANVRKIFIVFFSLFLLISNVFSQSSDEFKKVAEDAYKKGDFYNASVLYKQLSEIEKDNSEYIYFYANSCRLYNNYSEAKNTYYELIKSKLENKFPLIIFYYAEMNKYEGNYEIAIEYFAKFIELQRNREDFFLNKAKQEITSCNWAKQNTNNLLTAKINHLGKNVNTPYTEFGAVQLGDSILLYSSLRSVIQSEFESFLPDINQSKIYYSWISVAGYSSAKEPKGKLNDTEEHTANLCFDSKENKIYFTRCFNNENGEMTCKIYESYYKNKKWSKPRLLNKLVNTDGYTSTQPSISRINDKEVLYFSSNRPGGFGQLDLWYSIKHNGDFIQPVNLGSVINTPGNEISPYYDNANQKIYFASDWHMGYGGFDIFSSKGELNQWKIPENLGIPINSSYNDMYFNTNIDDTTEGYFTSNRKGSFYIKGETCCNDIYSFKLINHLKPEESVKDTVKIEESIRMLLPLTLYFHNDEPNPACMDTITEKNYKQTLSDYYILKEKYKIEYSKGLKSTEKQKAINDIEDFFNIEVETGFNKLERFAELLEKDLQKGNEIKITVKGYASPLNTEKYNINLSKRRISSLINYLKEYNNGSLLPYLRKNEENDSKLTIYEEPLGKSMASKTVSDNPNDLRNSVFSKAAALERKIQILYYDHTNTEIIDSTPKFQFITDSINYGRLSNKTTNAFTLRFINLGNYPLKINEISNDCNCMKFYWDDKQLFPNETGIINLLILPENKQGKQKVQITLKLQPLKTIVYPVYFEGIP